MFMQRFLQVGWLAGAPLLGRRSQLRIEGFGEFESQCQHGSGDKPLSEPLHEGKGESDGTQIFDLRFFF
jgi:hypothetical protein